MSGAGTRVLAAGAAPRTEELKVQPKSVSNKERMQQKREEDSRARTAELNAAIRKSKARPPIPCATFPLSPLSFSLLLSAH